MAQVLVKEVLSMVSTSLGDMNPQFTRWTESELVSWLNEAQRVIVKYLPFANVRLDAVKLQPGTRQNIRLLAVDSVKTGDGTPLTNAITGTVVQGVVRNMGSDGETPGRIIRLVERDLLDMSDPNWHTRSGESITQYVYDPRQPQAFYVTPAVPKTKDVWVELDYVADPALIEAPKEGLTLYAADGSNQTALSLGDKFSDDIVNYMMARAYMKDAEIMASASLMATHVNLFTASINAQSLTVLGINPNLKTLPLAMTPSAQASK